MLTATSALTTSKKVHLFNDMSTPHVNTHQPPHAWQQVKKSPVSAACAPSTPTVYADGLPSATYLSVHSTSSHSHRSPSRPCFFH